MARVALFTGTLVFAALLALRAWEVAHPLHPPRPVPPAQRRKQQLGRESELRRWRAATPRQLVRWTLEEIGRAVNQFTGG